MLEISVFIYGLLSMFVILAAQQNRRMERPNPTMVRVLGLGLFSMSTTLALLSIAMAVFLALR